LKISSPKNSTMTFLVNSCAFSHAFLFRSLLYVRRGSVTFFCAAGIACALYAVTSCRWFALTSKNNGWDFVDADKTENVGLFRFEDDESTDCIRYDSLFFGRDDQPWLFTAQLCVLLGPLVGLMAALANCCHGHTCTTACILLFAAGLQGATVVASAAPCNGFWNCPWLGGAQANFAATGLFLVGWIVVICGYRSDSITIRRENHNNNEEPAATKEASFADTDSGFDDDSEDVELGELELEFEQRKGAMTAEELLGTNDPIIHRAVAQKAKAVREFARSADSEEEGDEIVDTSAADEDHY
jgi:hypothetical protein